MTFLAQRHSLLDRYATKGVDDELEADRANELYIVKVHKAAKNLWVKIDGRKKTQLPTAVGGGQGQDGQPSRATPGAQHVGRSSPRAGQECCVMALVLLLCAPCSSAGHYNPAVRPDWDDAT